MKLFSIQVVDIEQEQQILSNKDPANSVQNEILQLNETTET